MAVTTQYERKRHCEERAPFASNEAIPNSINVGDCFVAKGGLLAMTGWGEGSS